MNMTNRKSSLILYINPREIASHRTRIVLAEKGITASVINIEELENAEDIADLNSYGSLPVLIDRNLVLYNSRIIMEYLDERFPHPPLSSGDPVQRARYRLMMYHIEKDWYSQVKIIDTGDKQQKEHARRRLLQHLIDIVPMFKENDYFFSNDFSILDCCIAPVLWRLPMLNINLPNSLGVIEKYSNNRLFNRPSFQKSLTEVEREMRLDLVEMES